MTKRKKRARRQEGVLIDGVPYNSLTPYLDALEEEKRAFLPDLARLRAIRPSPLDALFAGVADKHHGIDLAGDDDYGDEGDEP